jgi:hypothetical protein
MKTLCTVLFALILAAPCQAQTIDSSRYAAVAYSMKTKKYGYAWDCGSRFRAESTALANCRAADAEIITWTKFGYIVLLIAEDGAYGAGEVNGAGVSSAMAYDRALAQLRKHTKSKVKTAIRVCSGDVHPKVVTAEWRARLAQLRHQLGRQGVELRFQHVAQHLGLADGHALALPLLHDFALHHSESLQSLFPRIQAPRQVREHENRLQVGLLPGVLLGLGEPQPPLDDTIIRPAFHQRNPR